MAATAAAVPALHLFNENVSNSVELLVYLRQQLFIGPVDFRERDIHFRLREDSYWCDTWIVYYGIAWVAAGLGRV